MTAETRCVSVAGEKLTTG